ncbi:aldo/keto reductase [Spirosoma sp. 209]|uniref:aldo/keto reductase n=1 Tax=Spirosoma sp. 209 TaxID=1955701 RepID=UPI00098D0BE5|nr:aldo/keto reductase [Spirosoma sp. 209]
MSNQQTNRYGLRIGLGTWQFGGPNVQNGRATGWGDIDEATAVQTVHAALEQGVRFFDTADSYGAGQSERFLKRALANRPDAIICTKFGNVLTPASQPQDFSPAYLHKAVEDSLDRLGRDRLDILLLHSPPDNFDWSTYDPAPFDQLIQAGKIGAYGVSSKSVYGARRVMEAGFGSVLEVIYNALDRRAETVLFNTPEAGSYTFIGRVPLASGFLNPTYLTQEPSFPPDQYRHYLPDRDRNWLLTSVRSLAFLEELPGGLATSALRFCLSNEAVSVIIPGARNAHQVAANCAAEALGPLPDDILARIREAVPDVPDHWKPAVH